VRLGSLHSSPFPRVEEKICRVCGQPLSYVERRRRENRVYLYGVHRSWVGGRRRIKKHYLGVEERVRELEAFAPKVWGEVGSMERRRTLRSADVGLGGLREDKGHE